ncbi:hypothetical protein BAE44_0024207, partial [Dichanthelium oligosanthes]
MERPLRHLALLLGLLAWAAAAVTEAGAQPACEPSNLATQITLFCMPDMPTAPCCEPVVASVDLGGGVPCLCRVAAQPQLVLARLNASHLLALYTACGGLRTGGAHLAAACQVALLRDGVSLRVPVFRCGDEPERNISGALLVLVGHISGPSPPAATVPVIAPPPAAPRHKLPGREAPPPPPPTGEKPSPPPQKQPDIALLFLRCASKIWR